MKTIAYLFSGIILTAILYSCGEENPNVSDDFEIGKNYYTTIVGGDTREYFVHVPSIYNADNPIPVVFMLHGT